MVQVSPSYQEVGQHVFSGAQILFLLFDCATARPPSKTHHLFRRSPLLAIPQINSECNLCACFFFLFSNSISFFFFFYLPDRPVRSGPHLLQIPVPLRNFPGGFVDILAVVAGSDSLRHLTYKKNWKTRRLGKALLWSLFCSVLSAIALHTHCPRSHLCAHPRSLRSSVCVRRSGRSLRSPKATPAEGRRVKR